MNTIPTSCMTSSARNVGRTIRLAAQAAGRFHARFRRRRELRAAHRALSTLDTHMLEDIGLTPMDLMRGVAVLAEERCLQIAPTAEASS